MATDPDNGEIPTGELMAEVTRRQGGTGEHESPAELLEDLVVTYHRLQRLVGNVASEMQGGRMDEGFVRTYLEGNNISMSILDEDTQNTTERT